MLPFQAARGDRSGRRHRGVWSGAGANAVGPQRHGVVESVVNYGGGIVVAGVSDFGRRLLAFVGEAESHPDGQ